MPSAVDGLDVVEEDDALPLALETVHDVADHPRRTAGAEVVRVDVDRDVRGVALLEHLLRGIGGRQIGKAEERRGRTAERDLDGADAEFDFGTHLLGRTAGEIAVRPGVGADGVAAAADLAGILWESARAWRPTM